MAGYRLSHAAQDDIVSILAWTDEQFGEEARKRYEVLIATAIRDAASRADDGGHTSRPSWEAKCSPGTCLPVVLVRLAEVCPVRDTSSSVVETATCWSSAEFCMTPWIYGNTSTLGSRGSRQPSGRTATSPDGDPSPDGGRVADVIGRRCHADVRVSPRPPRARRSPLCR